MHMSNEERDLVYQFIYLSFVKRVLERDLKIIKKAQLKFPDLYVEFLMERIFAVGKRIGTLKREMYKRKINVYEEKHDHVAVYFLVVCRNYEENVSILNTIVRNNVYEYMKKYMT